MCIELELEKPVELHLEFDPEWKKFYEELGQQYGNPLDKYLEQAKLI